jgi:hypothetical protein
MVKVMAVKPELQNVVLKIVFSKMNSGIRENECLIFTFSNTK